MDEQNRNSRIRKDVVINTGLDLFLLFTSLMAVGNSALDHVIHIVFLIRLADYSSYRPRPRWPIFLVATPRSVLDMSPEGELVLFSALRILMRVWLVFGMAVDILLYAYSGGWEWHPTHEAIYRLGVLAFGLAILTIHLPKRMLMWHVAVRCQQVAAKESPVY